MKYYAKFLLALLLLSLLINSTVLASTQRQYHATNHDLIEIIEWLGKYGLDLGTFQMVCIATGPYEKLFELVGQSTNRPKSCYSVKNIKPENMYKDTVCRVLEQGAVQVLSLFVPVRRSSVLKDFLQEISHDVVFAAVGRGIEWRPCSSIQRHSSHSHSHSLDLADYSRSYPNFSTNKSAFEAVTAPQLSLKATTTVRLRVRSGPDTSYAIVGGIPGGSTKRYYILGKNATATWYKIRFNYTVDGWVHGDYVQTYGYLNNLPVVR